MQQILIELITIEMFAFIGEKKKLLKIYQTRLGLQCQTPASYLYLTKSFDSMLK